MSSITRALAALAVFVTVLIVSACTAPSAQWYHRIPLPPRRRGPRR